MYSPAEGVHSETVQKSGFSSDEENQENVRDKKKETKLLTWHYCLYIYASFFNSCERFSVAFS